MSRFKTEIQLNKPNEFVNFITNDFFNKEDFHYKEVKGEGVWQHGVGALSSPQFIKYSYENGVLTLEAWLKFAWLPGVYSGEMGLTGFFGALPKSALKGKVDQLTFLLNQPLPSNDPQYNQNNIDNNGQPVIIDKATSENANPIPVYTHDTSSKATISLVLGFTSLIGLLIPIIGIILAGFGIANGKRALNSKSKGLATAGIVISSIGMVLSILSWIISIILRAL